jgi:hypothetical protein
MIFSFHRELDKVTSPAEETGNQGKNVIDDDAKARLLSTWQAFARRHQRTP